MAEASTSNEGMGKVRRSERRPVPRRLWDYEEETESVVSEEEIEVSSKQKGKRPASGKVVSRKRLRTENEPMESESDIEVTKPSKRKGSRVLKARLLEECEVDKLQQLRKKRKKDAENLINKMTEKQAKELLIEIAAKQPSLVLDVAAYLQRDSEPPSPGVDGLQPWCICSRCPPMDRQIERVCCNMQPDFCISLRPEMDLVITDPMALHLQQALFNDIFVHEEALQGEDEINAKFRYLAYTQFTLWIHGRLGRGVRKPVPACCTKFIRNKFPSSSGTYQGYVRGPFEDL